MRIVKSGSDSGERSIPKLHSVPREMCVIHQGLSCGEADEGVRCWDAGAGRSPTCKAPREGRRLEGPAAF